MSSICLRLYTSTFQIHAFWKTAYVSVGCVLSIWNWDAWDSSVRWMRQLSNKRWRGVMRHRVGTGGRVSLFPHASKPQGYRHERGKWVKRRLSQSVSTHDPSPVMSHRLARLAWMHRGLAQRLKPHWTFFSWFWERRFPAVVCIAVRRAKLTLMMNSHSCEVICVCVCTVLVAVSFLYAISTEIWSLLLRYKKQITKNPPLITEKKKKCA